MAYEYTMSQPWQAPTGRKYAMLSTNYGATSIKIYNIGNKTVTQLTRAQTIWNPCWSPDDNYVIAMSGIGPSQYQRVAEKHGEVIALGPKVVLIPGNATDVDIEEIKKSKRYFSIGLKEDDRVVNGTSVLTCYDLVFSQPRIFDCK